jgi:hypothetical protein
MGATWRRSGRGASRPSLGRRPASFVKSSDGFAGICGHHRSQPPRGKRRLGRHRVILEAVHGRPLHAGCPGDLDHARRALSEHVADRLELLPRECRLAAKVRRVRAALRMVDSGPLAGFGRFGLWRGSVKGREAA